MKDVRIKPITERLLLVSVTCDCGSNCHTDENSGLERFRHEVSVGGTTDRIIVCNCGNKFRLHPQGNHVHVMKEN